MIQKNQAVHSWYRGALPTGEQLVLTEPLGTDARSDELASIGPVGGSWIDQGFGVWWRFSGFNSVLMGLNSVLIVSNGSSGAFYGIV